MMSKVISVNALEAELKRVRQELEVVKQERDIIKKAINAHDKGQMFTNYNDAYHFVPHFRIKI